MSSPLSGGSSVLSNTTTTATALGNLALVVPVIKNGFAQTKGYQPKNPPNPDGTPSKLPLPKSFLFDYEGEQTTELTSDITDHAIEDNTFVQDQIALRPIKVTTKGFVSELNDIPPFFLQPFRDIAQKLTAISAYAPALSATALIAYDEALFVYQTAIGIANSAIAAWGSIGTVSPDALEFFPNQTKQQIAFSLFKGYWATRTRFTIQTPWAVFDDMVIERLHPIQNEDTQSYTTFEITFKQMIFVKSAVLNSQSAISQERLANQSQPLNNTGTSTPVSDIDLGTGLSGPNFSGLFA